MDIDDEAPAYPPVRTNALLLLAVFALLFALYVFRAAPLQLDPVRAGNGPEQFDTSRAIDRLTGILDGTPHPVDSDALDQTRERLLAAIGSLGYEPEVYTAPACRGSISGSAIRCATVSNILFRAGPETGPALGLTAHYDSVEASPGFGDDGIGLAVWLEVAHHLRQTPPQRPVVFLFTDGEETALLGAEAFVNAGAHGVEVGRVINLEARGVRGPAMMFETSHPNAGVVSDWARNGARPFSNSMMTAVYELLPNSTDLTVHLEDGYPGINIAISGGVEFYHTPHDDLAHLSRESVQHMGDQALGATRAFLASDWSLDRRPGAELAYSDFASRVFIALPQTFTLVLLGLCFGLSALLFMRPAKDADWKHPDWRALALPPATAIVSGLIAWGGQALIGLARPEPAFWTAHPEGMNAVFFIGALLAAAAALAFLAPRSSRAALFASGWLWFLVVGMGLSIAVPGFAMIYLIPGAVFVVCAVVAWLLPRFALAAYGVAGAVLVIVFFPLIQMVETTMGLGLAAVFGVLIAMVIAPLLPLAGPLPSGRTIVFSVLGAGLVAAIIATATLPAFSPERPLALNFTAHYDMDAREAQLYASTQPGALPKDVARQLVAANATTLPGVTARLASRKLDFIARPSASALPLSSSASEDGGRALTLRLSAPDARMVRLRIPVDARPRQLSYGGNEIAMREAQSGYFIVDCVGRTCDGAELTFMLDADAPTGTDAPEWIVQGYWLGLPPDASVTADARGPNALPIQMGDVTITTKRQAL